jgi:hypothetical protein
MGVRHPWQEKTLAPPGPTRRGFFMPGQRAKRFEAKRPSSRVRIGRVGSCRGPRMPTVIRDLRRDGGTGIATPGRAPFTADHIGAGTMTAESSSRSK